VSLHHVGDGTREAGRARRPGAGVRPRARFAGHVLAILYDVHGNLPALEAVLADAATAGATRYALGGDYALFGGSPAETVARLDALRGATWIRGNGERWTADPSQAPLPAIAEAARFDPDAA